MDIFHNLKKKIEKLQNNLNWLNYATLKLKRNICKNSRRIKIIYRE